MTRGVHLYLAGSLVLVSLAGCGRGFFQAEREPWRAEAEVACLKSGAVKEGPERVRIDPISGPGACGADFPLKVAAFGEGSGSFGFADEPLRRPASIGNPPRWPVSPPPAPFRAPYPDAAQRQPDGRAPTGPLSLAAPGIAPRQDEIDLPAEAPP
ncbi:MAG: extensin, partial [Bradyrhizobium sp.]